MNQRFAFVLMIKPEGYDFEGNLILAPALLERQPVEWLDPWNCEHQEAMCAMCIETWACDYMIWLPEGIDE